MFEEINKQFRLEFEKKPKELISLGLVKEQYLKKFFEILNGCHGLGHSESSLVLRKQGELLDKETLKSMGMSVRVKIGKKYLEGLTEKGLADPVEAASNLCYVNLLLKNRILNFRNSRPTRFIAKVKINSSKDLSWNCCNKAREQSENKYDIEDTPLVPLVGCDKWCACAYTYTLAQLN